LHAARFCKTHLLCPLCAIRRGSKLVQAYMDRLAVVKAAQPDLMPFLVTFTVKDGPDLSERFNHLFHSIQKLHKSRLGTWQHSEARKASAAVWSYEFKRGANSGLWHPHVHAVWLCREAPDQAALAAQWKAITGDSYIVDVRPFHDEQETLSGFLEVFKYAVKFADLPMADNWEGYEKLRGKRLIASFGDFRGIEVPEDLTDTPLDELPYLEMLYKFVYGVGYSHAAGDRQVEKVFPEKRNLRNAWSKMPQAAPPAMFTHREAHLRRLQLKHHK
jgi:hypothetical protein